MGMELWVGLHFPELALAAAFDGIDHATPCALVGGHLQRRSILGANPAATALGVMPGQSLAAAQMRCTRLYTRPRARTAEAAMLREWAAWAYQFSGHVSLAPPQALLIEAQASLRLFGGWPGLERRMRQGLAAMGQDVRMAAAPQAAAAWLLARHHPGLCIDTDDVLLRVLSQLPLTQAGLPRDTVRGLSDMGLQRLGQLFALPRPELQRRLGGSALDWLDRLRGMRAQTLPAWHPPTRFEHRLELEMEATGGGPLLFPLRRMLQVLGHHLLARDGGVQHMQLVLEHADASCTRVPLHLASPRRDPDRLFTLLRTRIERLVLPAPVRALVLEAEQLPVFQPGLRDLFTPVHGDGLDWTTLRERLQARLGQQALSALSTHAEHRPERAWLIRDEPGMEAARESRPRPLWLMPQARILRGEACILAGPERIESGWWDGGDMRRDYYVLRTACGQHAWAYRSADAPCAWMLHGWFA